jgi:hypothetical protein
MHHEREDFDVSRQVYGPSIKHEFRQLGVVSRQRRPTRTREHTHDLLQHSKRSDLIREGKSVAVWPASDVLHHLLSPSNVTGHVPRAGVVVACLTEGVTTGSALRLLAGCLSKCLCALGLLKHPTGIGIQNGRRIVRLVGRHMFKRQRSRRLTNTANSDRSFQYFLREQSGGNRYRVAGRQRQSGDTAPLYPTLFRANPLQFLHFAKINPTDLAPPLDCMHRSAGEQSGPLFKPMRERGDRA